MPEQQGKRREPLRGPSAAERERRAEKAALDALLVAAARYGAATAAENRAALLVASREARRAYEAARARCIDAECADASKRIAKWFDQVYRRYARPGARWSTERAAGYSEAMRLVYDWIRVLSDRANANDDLSDIVPVPSDASRRRLAAVDEQVRQTKQRERG